LKLSLFHISLPKEGETRSGDAVVTRVENGVAFLAVIDVLGHGAPAAVVADRGRIFLESVPLSESILAITEGLHYALHDTRGAAAMCCILKKGRIEGCGVGNVEMRSKDRVPVLLTPGILGKGAPRFRVFESGVTQGGRIIMFSDGLSPRIDMERAASMSTETACKTLMERYRRPIDDATLLVADIEAFSM